MRDLRHPGIWSRRVWLAHNDQEIEFGFASVAWADVSPVDPGTGQVIAGGCRILYDPKEILSRLCAEVGEVAK